MKLSFRNFRGLSLLFGIGLLAYLVFSSAGSTQAQTSATGLLKVKNSDGPIAVSLNESVIASWSGLPTSTSYTCNLSNYAGYTYSIPLTSRSSGQTTYTVKQAQLLELGCSSTSAAPVVDNVVINISGSSVPAPTPSTSTADLWAEYGTTKVGDRAGGNATSFSVNSGQSITLKWACPASNTGVKLNDTAIAIGGTASGSRPAQTVTQNTTWHLQCYTSATAYLDDWLTANVTAVPAPTPTPVPAPTGTITINGQKEVTLGLNDPPAKLKWTKNQFSCDINFRSISNGISSTFAYLEQTDTEGENEINSDFVLINGEVEFSLICDPDTTSKVVDKATLRLKKVTVTFKVNEVLSDRDGQGLSFQPLGSAQICSEKGIDNNHTCYLPLTNSQGITTFEIQQGQFLFIANKIGYYSDGQWETIDSNKTIEIDLINRNEVTSRVAGHVKDRNGKAVAGIAVGIVRASRTSLNGLYAQDTFIQTAATNKDGLFIFDLSTISPSDLSQSYQVAVLTSAGYSWRVKVLSSTFKFDTIYGQYKKIDIVYSPEANNTINLYFRLLSFDTMEELSDRAKQNVNIIIKTKDGFVVWSGTGDKFIEFIRQRSERDLAREPLIIEIQSSEYSSIKRQIFVGVDTNRSYDMILRPKNQDYCRRRPQSNSNDFWFCGYESEENAFFADPVNNNIVQTIDRQVKSMAGSQKMPTVRIVQQASYDGSLSIDDIYKGCDASVSLNISTGLLQTEKNNIPIIQHITAHEFGHFKDYYNAGQCNIASNQSGYIFSLEKIDTHVEGPIFYKLINEQYYDQASIAGGLGHANANRHEAYASTFHIKLLHGSDALYSNTWNSMSGSFQGIVSRYTGLVIQSGEVK